MKEEDQGNEEKEIRGGGGVMIKFEGFVMCVGKESAKPTLSQTYKL